MKSCVCGSGKSIGKCCGRFLEQGMQARTPEQLMRSRYAAYALGGFGQYLLDTWFPATASGLSEKSLSQNTVQWQKLEVISKAQVGDEGKVEFKAYFSQPGSDAIECMHEHSVFRRVKGKWFYVGAEVQ